MVYAGIVGLGFGAPLILLIAGVQLVTPHRIIATATAVIITSRAVAGSTFVAIYSAAVNNRAATRVPGYLAAAAVSAGVPADAIPTFIGAIAGGKAASLQGVDGISSSAIAAGSLAYKTAMADSFRIVYIIAAPFGVVGIIACYWLGDLKSSMTYKVDAPLEELHAKARSAPV